MLSSLIRRWPILLNFIFLILTAGAGHAAEIKARGYVGALGGLSLSSDVSPAFAVGATAIYRIVPLIGAGLYFQHYKVSATATASDSSQVIFSRSTQYYGVDGQLFGSSSLKGVHGGLRAGYGRNTLSLTTTTSDGSVLISDPTGFFYAGPVLGYDYFFWRFSGGVDISYMYGFLSATAPSAFLFNLALKFWY